MTFSGIFNGTPIPEEHAICQKRGHEPGGSSLTQGKRTIYQCKWCYTQYWIEVTREVHELNAPAQPEQSDG